MIIRNSVPIENYGGWGKVVVFIYNYGTRQFHSIIINVLLHTHTHTQAETTHPSVPHHKYGRYRWRCDGGS